MSDVARAATQTVAIGVDHAPPSGRDFEYVDFFPRSGVKIHSGDVIDFGFLLNGGNVRASTILGSSTSFATALNTVAPINFAVWPT